MTKLAELGQIDGRNNPYPKAPLSLIFRLLRRRVDWRLPPREDIREYVAAYRASARYWWPYNVIQGGGESND